MGYRYTYLHVHCPTCLKSPFDDTADKVFLNENTCVGWRIVHFVR